MFKNFIGNVIRNSRAFRTVIATSQSDKNSVEIDTKKAGVGEFEKITKAMPNTICSGMPLLMATFKGGKTVLGISPFVSNTSVVEVKRK